MYQLIAHGYISIVKPTRCTSFSNLFYFGIKLYMTYSNGYVSNRYCYLFASGNEMELQFHLVPASK